MKTSLKLLLVLLLCLAIFPRSSIHASGLNLSGTFTGAYTQTLTNISCDPNNTPVILSGSVEVTGLAPSYAVMFGPVDKGLIESGDPGWGSGAYAYFGHIGPNIRVGPSDGFLGGELNQVGANVPYVSGGPNLIDFTATIYDGQITVTYNSTNYVDTYGGIEDANAPDAYLGGEFDGGAYFAINLFDLDGSVDYDITISGCTLADDEGPITKNVATSPNPIAVSGAGTVTANVDDTTNGNSTIASAEYSLDGGAWMPMNAQDGAFDEVSEDVTVAFTAPDTAGIYNLCVLGTDAPGNTGAAECVMLVVYDPDGGFVTGGGWIDSPAGAASPIPVLVWDQGFESGTSGWLDSNSGWYGTITQVASGTGGFASASGSFHALVEGDASSAPFSRFDGYRDTWPGTWTAELDVYLKPDAWAAGEGFDYSVAATGSDGNHQRDYIFHLTQDTSTSKLLVAGSNNTNFAPRQDLENINHYEVTAAGWYTLQHVFYEQGGALAVDLNLLDSNGAVLFTETRYNAADTIPAEVGGNRYAWFTHVTVAGGVIVDNHQLNIPILPTGKANFGFVAKYKKGAQTPDGNTEFVFQAADLNFHSSSYDWLVVNQGGSNAQFKGAGTINGQNAPNGQAYKFMIWAGDGNPDTFRIKIWWEENSTEHVVYDNGTDQPIGGGSIVIHTGKK